MDLWFPDRRSRNPALRVHKDDHGVNPVGLHMFQSRDFELRVPQRPLSSEALCWTWNLRLIKFKQAEHCEMQIFSLAVNGFEAPRSAKL